MSRTPHPVRSLVIVATALLAIAPTQATSRHHKSDDRRPARVPKHAAKPTSSPKGVVTVPAGGLKIYCAGSRSPLLVRKFTQGSGTTVTVLCR